MRRMTIALLALTLSMPVMAQKKFEGTIKLSIEYIDLPEQMQAMSAMLPDEMTVKIKGDQSLLQQSLGMGMSQTTISNMKKKDGIMLMDMMGKKTAIKMSSDDFKEMKAKKEDDFTLEYVDGETKTIAGYKCKKAVVSMKDGGKVDVFYTNELPSAASRQYNELKGFPLEYTIDGGQFKMKLTATDVVKEKVDPKLFDIPDGYEMMTFEEFQESMKGMMGGK